MQRHFHHFLLQFVYVIQSYSADKVQYVYIYIDIHTMQLICFLVYISLLDINHTRTDGAWLNGRGPCDNPPFLAEALVAS